MDAKEFVKKKVEEEGQGGQTKVARKIGVSIGTINNILYSPTELQLSTIRKIAKAYEKPITFFVAEESGGYYAQPEVLDDMDQKLIQVVQGFTREEKKRILEDLEDKLLVKEVKKSRESGSQ